MADKASRLSSDDPVGHFDNEPSDNFDAKPVGGAISGPSSKSTGSSALSALFLDFMVASGALLFGDFTLKSGRKSPYFINTGEYKTGAQLARLGDFYGKLIQNSVRSPESAGDVDEKLDDEAKALVNGRIRAKYDLLYGPAYKGIPLATVAASRLAADGLDLYVSYNRKERKDHGEGDLIMGYKPKDGDRIAIIEDVTTAGTSIRETAALLEDLGISAKIAALYISVDRMERGSGGGSAIAQLREELGVEVYAIATALNIIEYLDAQAARAAQAAQASGASGSGIPGAAGYAAAMRKYLDEYGAIG